MGRVLIITYYWPPSGGSGVQRWVKFSKYLPSEGWQPVIYTPENPEMQSVDQSLYGDIPAEAEIIRRPITEIYSLYRGLTGKKASAAEVNVVNSQHKSFLQRMVMWVRGNLFIPDPRVSWVRPSVRFLTKYLREHPVDVIVSTGPPHSMHLIGWKVARATGIPWIADFRDPWTRIFYFKHLSLTGWARRRHEKLEQAVLDEASAVVAVSPLVQEEFRTMTSNRVELITNGYDPDDYAQPVEPDGYFNLTHTGQFAADGNPLALWKVLGDKVREDAAFARKLRIRLAGKTDAAILQAIREAGLGEQLVDLGYRDHLTAVREQLNASVLILPLRQEPEYRATLPGKLFEYLGARRPILGIGQTDGAMARIVGQTHAGEVYDWPDAAGLRSAIDRFWEAFLFTENGKPKSSLIIYTFSLSLVFTAMYILCYEVSIRLLTGLLASLPAFFSNLVIALVSSAAGTLLCCLPHRFFSDSRLVFGGHLWLCLYAAAVLVIMLVIMGPSPDYGAFLIFCCWFILPPVLLGTAVSCRLYLRSRPDSKESEPEPEWKKYVSRR